MPVPGIEAVPINPRELTFRVKGAPPMLALSPLFERFNRRPGMTVNDFRKRQPMIHGPCFKCFEDIGIVLQTAFNAKHTKVLDREESRSLAEDFCA